MSAAQADVYERKLGKTAGFMRLGENELILLCGKCKEEIMQNNPAVGTVGREKGKNEITGAIVWIGVRSSGCRCTGFIIFFYVL